MRRSSSRRRQGGWLAHRPMIFTKRQLPPITFAVDQVTQPNLFTLSGSPTGPCDLVVTLNSGIVLRVGMDCGAFAAGTTIKFVNNGTAAGPGGAGGSGGVADGATDSSGSAGFAGGDAIICHAGITLAIDNTNGFIFGGPGGGGGGEACADFIPPGSSARASGGGGGGAQGYNNPSGGIGGGGGVPGSAGSNGDSTNPAYGGSGGNGFGNTGGGGGQGGAWGQAGSAGNGASGPHTFGVGAGGAAGYAIRKNGGTVAFIAGNNTWQVRGLVA